MTPPSERHNSNTSTGHEPKTLSPEAGRDIERPRGGPKGPLLAFGLLAILVIIGLIAGNLY